MPQPTDTNLPTVESARLISTDRVEGTRVYNREGDLLGNIRTLMIEKHSGRVAYAVMSFGGFLGIGDRYHPLPWDVLSYDEAKDGYVVPLDKSALENAPHFGAADAPDWADEKWGRSVFDYYGVVPFWMP